MSICTVYCWWIGIYSVRWVRWGKAQVLTGSLVTHTRDVANGNAKRFNTYRNKERNKVRNPEKFPRISCLCQSWQRPLLFGDMKKSSCDSVGHFRKRQVTIKCLVCLIIWVCTYFGFLFFCGCWGGQKWFVKRNYRWKLRHLHSEFVKYPPM